MEKTHDGYNSKFVESFKDNAVSEVTMIDPNNPTYLANLPSSVAAIATNPTVQTPSHQIGQQLPHSQLNTQQLVSQQQLALLAAYSAAAYSQAGSTLVAAVPNLTDLQAYNIITTLPPHSSAQQASGNQGSTANLLSNSMLSNTNNSMVNQALMTNYILPGTGLPAHSSLKNNLVLNRQAIKLEICREFQRFACKRLETECRYAHPPAHVHRTQDGSSVVVCSIFLKRGCTREQCRFFHPPSNLMDQVKQQQISQQQNYYNQQQLLTQHQLQQRAATMMLANQSMGFPRVVPLTKRPALDKMLLPTNTYEHALALQPSFHLEKKSTSYSDNVAQKFLRRFSNTQPDPGFELEINKVITFCESIKETPTELMELALSLSRFSSYKIDTEYANAEASLRQNNSLANLNSTLNLTQLHFMRRSKELVKPETIRISNRISPKSLPSSTILNWQLLEILWEWLPDRLMVSEPVVLFSMAEDGNSLSTFYTKADMFENREDYEDLLDEEEIDEEQNSDSDEDSKKNTFPFDDTNLKIAYGASSMQGWRTSQEDAHLCILDFDENMSLFGVFDGHGGAEVAQYTSAEYPKFLKNNKFFKEKDYLNALKNSFIEFDSTLVKDDVYKKLKILAGDDMTSDEEKEDEEMQPSIDTLKEEASLPIQELLDRFINKQTLKDVIKKTQEKCSSSSKKNVSNEPCSSSKIKNNDSEEKELNKSSQEVSSSSNIKKNEESNIECSSSSKNSKDDKIEKDTNAEIDLPTSSNSENQSRPGKDSGCTAVVALLVGNQLYVANAGDSRCVLSRNGEAIDLSIDHKPFSEIEFSRIKKAGGRVNSDGRINGGLNLSRALGDHSYKQNKNLPLEEQMITALPDVEKIEIKPEDDFLVIACDGIWNSLSSQEVVDFIKNQLKTKQKLSKICDSLFYECLAGNTHGDGTGCDNMTCLIIKLRNLEDIKEEDNNESVKENNGKRKHQPNTPSNEANNREELEKGSKLENELSKLRSSSKGCGGGRLNSQSSDKLLDGRNSIACTTKEYKLDENQVKELGLNVDDSFSKLNSNNLDNNEYKNSLSYSSSVSKTVLTPVFKTKTVEEKQNSKPILDKYSTGYYSNSYSSNKDNLSPSSTLSKINYESNYKDYDSDKTYNSGKLASKLTSQINKANSQLEASSKILSQVHSSESTIGHSLHESKTNIGIGSFDHSGNNYYGSSRYSLNRYGSGLNGYENTKGSLTDHRHLHVDKNEKEITKTYEPLYTKDISTKGGKLIEKSHLDIQSTKGGSVKGHHGTSVLVTNEEEERIEREREKNVVQLDSSDKNLIVESSTYDDYIRVSRDLRYEHYFTPRTWETIINTLSNKEIISRWDSSIYDEQKYNEQAEFHMNNNDTQKLISSSNRQNIGSGGHETISYSKQINKLVDGAREKLMEQQFESSQRVYRQGGTSGLLSNARSTNLLPEQQALLDKSGSRRSSIHNQESRSITEEDINFTRPKSYKIDGYLSDDQRKFNNQAGYKAQRLEYSIQNSGYNTLGKLSTTTDEREEIKSITETHIFYKDTTDKVSKEDSENIPGLNGNENKDFTTETLNSKVEAEKQILKEKSDDLPPFDEWKKKVVEEEPNNQQTSATINNSNKKLFKNNSNDPKLRIRNYASSECGAKVINSNKEAQGSYKILFESQDEYMLNPYTICPRSREEANVVGRQCLRKCRQDSDCISNRKRCLCDGLCGLSCIRPESCKKLLSPPKNGIIYGPYLKHGSKIIIECKDGFDLVGSSSATCNFGKWLVEKNPECHEGK
ncbi:hypothetical protein RND71_043958 [Anisodus tanguticus]|uniref:protein-serine/threonine phosphatase n=1 Tax=Anisodus tanguticus TaxID=243964 RepID=A0AAE1QNX1_9SOLA|nr:hypothetical protein RND71_043958 [Anisodus tanguticus]